MDQSIHNKIVSFIWGIADDVLRDLFKRANTPMSSSPCASFAVSTLSSNPPNQHAG